MREPETRAALQSYADGVNQYLDNRSNSRIALEYTVLGLGGLDSTPEKWTPVDSLACLKAMAWDLRCHTEDELATATLSVFPQDGARKSAAVGKSAYISVVRGASLTPTKNP